MSQNPPTNDSDPERGDHLDRLLADFFQAKLQRPWPDAPMTVIAKPSSLVATGVALSEAPRNQPAARDTNRKSRYTLAVSVALILGSCWYLSNGFQPAPRPGSAVSPSGLLRGAEASKPATGVELRQDNAIKGNGGRSRPPVKLP